MSAADLVGSLRHRHLFGKDRLIPPRPLRDGIAALQGNLCFYCLGNIRAQPEADHFIPRVRCGIDAVENLVMADRRCNNDKRDMLPAHRHVTAWTGHNRRHATALTELAAASRWDTDPEATLPWLVPSTAICRRWQPAMDGSQGRRQG